MRATASGYPTSALPGRCQCARVQTEVEVGQVIQQTTHFFLLMLDQPGQLGGLGDQGRNQCRKFTPPLTTRATTRAELRATVS
jgi:hypothetical protein